MLTSIVLYTLVSFFLILRIVYKMQSCEIKLIPFIILLGVSVMHGSSFFFQVLASFWSMHHSDTEWEDPFLFKPERFLEHDGSLKPANDPVRKRRDNEYFTISFLGHSGDLLHLVSVRRRPSSSYVVRLVLTNKHF